MVIFVVMILTTGYQKKHSSLVNAVIEFSIRKNKQLYSQGADWWIKNK